MQGFLFLNPALIAYLLVSSIYLLGWYTKLGAPPVLKFAASSWILLSPFSQRVPYDRTVFYALAAGLAVCYLLSGQKVSRRLARTGSFMALVSIIVWYWLTGSLIAKSGFKL